MSKIKKIEPIKEAIPVLKKEFDHDEVQTVNARDVWQFLEIKKDFSDWIKHYIKRYDFIEGQDCVRSPNLGSEDKRELRDRVEAENQGTAVYLPGEIECLVGLGSEEVKRLNMVKNAFPGGEFISAGNAEDSIFGRIDLSAGRCRGICLPTSSNDDLGN